MRNQSTNWLKTILSQGSASVALAVAGATQAQPGYDYFLTGSASDAQVGVALGGVLLAGGGDDVDSAMRWFKSQAQGGDIVVLRTSGSDGYNDYLFSEIGGTAIDSVETFVFDRRSASSDPFVLQSIYNAEGIFFAGGDQRDYFQLWHGTPLEDAINAQAAAGAVVGGTSAGLAILGSSAYVALEDSLTSARALANPYDRDVTVTHDFLSLPLTEGLITDSHFENRYREGRLMTLLARSLDETASANFRGIGINDSTAVVIESDGTATVHGRRRPDRAALVFEATQPAEVLTPNQPLTLRDIRAIEFSPGDVFDFTTFTAADGVGGPFSYNVVNGVLSVGPAIDPPSPLAGDMNTDGTVDLNDVLAFVAALEDPAGYAATFGRPAAEHGDLNGDGIFNLNDARPFAELFDDASTPRVLAQIIPEPATVGWLAGLALLAVQRRRR
ncbi:MAG: Type 1 glutamine amidotransferase-like domain-containing protein [Planctomycetota bacterium]